MRGKKNKVKKARGFQSLVIFSFEDAVAKAMGPFMTHKLFHTSTAAWIYIKVSLFCTTQSRLVSVNVADENPTYKTGLCKYLKEGHAEVNKYKIRKTDFVNVLVLKAEKTVEINLRGFLSSVIVENVWSVPRSGLINPGISWYDGRAPYSA
jgi:hypothetical protein